MILHQKMLVSQIYTQRGLMIGINMRILNAELNISHHQKYLQNHDIVISKRIVEELVKKEVEVAYKTVIKVLTSSTLKIYL